MSLEFTTYEIAVAPRAPVRLPDFAGSLLRGTFGKALRELACATRLPSCDGCRVADSCTYREVFDPLPPDSHALQKFSAIPPPFVLHVHQWGSGILQPGEQFRFGITLMGSVRRHLPLVVLALQRGAGRGWTRDAVTFDLARVTTQADGQEAVVLDPREGRIKSHPSTATLQSMAYSGPQFGEVSIELLTPGRLQQDGRPARPEELTARTWLLALARRVSLLADFHGTLPLGIDFQSLAASASGCEITQRSLRWQEWERWSGKQRQTMPMGGLTGTLTIAGELGPFIKLIRFAERLHVGKHASFGLGAYRLVEWRPSAGGR